MVFFSRYIFPLFLLIKKHFVLIVFCLVSQNCLFFFSFRGEQSLLLLIQLLNQRKWQHTTLWALNSVI